MKNQAESFDNANAITLVGTGLSDREAISLRRELRPGDIVGGVYQLQSLLGRGGMGYVFSVFHKNMGREYALKMLAPEQMNETTRARFEIEAKAIARMDHPNIVKVYDMGIDTSDCPFYVMDLLEGESLADNLQENGSLSFSSALVLLRQIASGLSYAHAKGIVHRDMKPSNVVLLKSSTARRPAIKIVDFGIAKLLPSANLQTQSQTATGEVFGSPFYMSPEQSMGDATDERSDIYSLGCTFFEMLTGKVPYRGENALQTILMHQNAPIPDPGDITGAKLPEGAILMLERMMAKRPEHRYQTMQELIHDIDRLVDHKEIGKAATVALDEFDNDGQAQLKALTTAGAAIARVALIFGVIALTAGGSLWYYQQTHKVDEVKALRDKSAQAAKAALTADPNKLQGLANKDILDIPAHMADLRSEKLKAALKAYAACKKIYAYPIGKKKGFDFQCLVFPEESIGTVVPNKIWGLRQAARGKVEFRADLPLSLNIGDGISAAVIQAPEIMDKVSPSIFEEVTIERSGAISADDLTSDTSKSESNTGGDNDASIVDRGITRILKSISKWTKLRELTFNGVHMASEFYEAISQCKSLTGISIMKCSLDDAIGKQSFLLRLKGVRIQECSNLKPIIDRLAFSTTLNDLAINRCEVTPDDLKEVVKCPSLYFIDIHGKQRTESVFLRDGTDVTDIALTNTVNPKAAPVPVVVPRSRFYSAYELVQPFRNCRHAFKLVIRDNSLTQAQVRVLLSWPVISELVIDRQYYKEQARIFKSMPNGQKLTVVDMFG